MFEATWLPWLEGVAQYVELLADPNDNPNEIMTVHEAVRSLIDFFPRDGVLSGRNAVGDADEAAEYFDSFVGAALKRFSRLRHGGYLEDETNSPTYLLGYLAVRSVVARWEATLGHRIKPIYAAKLLVAATVAGTGRASVNSVSARDLSIDSLKRTMLEWVRAIAEIDNKSLRSFFEDVERSMSGHRYVWKDQRPRRVHREQADSDRYCEELDKAKAYLERLSQSLVMTGRPPVSDKPFADESEPGVRAILELVSMLFEDYLVMSRFLPVGKYMAGIILMEEFEKVAICVRTYADLLENVDPSHAYCTISFDVDRKAQQALRHLCANAGTARVLATRVVDLTGDDDRGHRPASYTCFFLGDGKWKIVGVGRNVVRTPEMDDEYVEMLRHRVVGLPYIDGGDQRLGSLDFLSGRLAATDPNSSAVRNAKSFDRTSTARRVALALGSLAFSLDAGKLERLVDASLERPELRAETAAWLHRTGTGDGQWKGVLNTDLLKHIAGGRHSGVTAFGG